jgi:hypothetical protein
MRLIAPKPHPNIQPKDPVAPLANSHGSSRIVKAPRKPGKDHAKSLTSLRATVGDTVANPKGSHHPIQTKAKGASLPKSDIHKLESKQNSKDPNAESKSEFKSNSKSSPMTDSKGKSKPIKSDLSPKESGNHGLIDLENNPDYIALSSAFDLLASQKTIASQDIVQLKELKSAALQNPEKFIQKLQAGKGENFPDRQKVVRAPLVPWSKYGIYNPGLDQRLATGIVNRTPSFGETRIFGDSPGERRPSL